MEKRLKSIVILGGGTAGWMTAAALSKVLGTAHYNITLVESDSISSVGVGEATIPQMLLFNAVLGIDEDEFIRRTKATFKLGIEFRDWRRVGHRYMHPFGKLGGPIGTSPFHHYWRRAYMSGQAEDLWHYSFATRAAYANKFIRPQKIPNSPLADVTYAFHFDAMCYAQFLRQYSEQRGVERVEAKMSRALQCPDSGLIEALEMEDGRRVEGDFFIDCSGARALLIGEALAVPYKDWKAFLPCDRALAVPSEKPSTSIAPYTSSWAKTAGWQWRIPLQHRLGNGLVYASDFMKREEAEKLLLQDIETTPLAQPRLIKFTTGHRREFWTKNCVAIGLSAGFLEPLESTSIHLIQTSIARLLSLFPGKNFFQQDIDKFNRDTLREYKYIRDFLVLHYSATERDDSDFWLHCRRLPQPESLKEKISLFKNHGRIIADEAELFNETSWVTVLHGQGVHSKDYNPVVDSMPTSELKAKLAMVEKVLEQSVNSMPSHQDILAKILL